jgi:hypothetical protein
MKGIIINSNIRKYCISLVFLAFSVSPVIAAQNKYQDETIIFYYPSDWELSTIKERNLEIRLRPKNWLRTKESSEYSMGDFALYISLSSGNFSKVAKAAGFVLEGEKWSIEGRHGAKGEIEEIKGKNWKGIVAEVPKGIFYKQGGYAGLGSAMTAILTDGKTTMVITGEALSDKEGDAILKSIEFIHKK